MKSVLKILCVFALTLTLLFLFAGTARAEDSISFSLDSVDCKINHSAEISMRAKSSKKPCAAVFDFKYDKTRLNLTDVKNSDSANVSYSDKGGSLTVSFFCKQGADLSDNAALFTLKFKPLSDGNAEVSFNVRDCADDNARLINVGNCSSGTVKINPSQGGQSGTEKSSAAKTIKDKKSAKGNTAESTNENVNDGSEDNDDDTTVSTKDSGTADSAVKDYSNILIVIIICAAVVISVAVISITIYFLKTKDKLQKY